MQYVQPSHFLPRLRRGQVGASAGLGENLACLNGRAG
jgi:hypothetical protein